MLYIHVPEGLSFTVKQMRLEWRVGTLELVSNIVYELSC